MDNVPVVDPWLTLKDKDLAGTPKSILSCHCAIFIAAVAETASVE